MLPDAGPQPGRHHVDVEDLGIGRVDAADNRRHETLEDPPAHPGTDQRGDARVLGAGADRGGQHGVEGGPERAQESERAADFGIPGVGGDAEHPGAGQFPRTVGELDPGAARIRRDDLAGKAQLGGEVRHGGRARGKGLGAAVQGQAGHDVAAHAAAPVAGGLQDCGAGAGQGEFAGSEQAGDPAADHDGGAGAAGAGRRRYSRRRPGLRPRRYSGEMEWMSSTTRVSTAGSVSGGTPWPRFSTWPGAAAPAAITARTWASRTSQGAESSAGSMLPCSGTVPPRRRLASSSGSR